MVGREEEIISVIPHLRRYARILTGSQEAGDAWVEQCLESVAERPTDSAEGEGLKLALFRRLHQVGETIKAGASQDEQPSGGIREFLCRALDRLPPTDRQVLTLVVIEGFTLEEAGETVGLSDTEAREAFEAARQKLKRSTVVPILIIEDEPLIAMDLAKTVKDMGYRVCGMANRESKAVASAEEEPPALILADIQLAEGDNGISAVQSILRKYDVPVIFVTGFPERLLAGQTPEPTYVVTKPFDPESLKLTIDQAMNHHAAAPPQTH